jgi:hypothetical protein
MKLKERKECACRAKNLRSENAALLSRKGDSTRDLYTVGKKGPLRKRAEELMGAEMGGVKRRIIE